MSGVIIAPSNICNLTKDEKRALQGTEGTPGDSNRYVTDQDTRVLPSSNTNTGTMSAADYTLLHSLGTGSTSGLTDLQMAMLAELATGTLRNENASSLGLGIIEGYQNIVLFSDGIMPVGSSRTNLSRNGGKLTLKPDPATSTIQLVDDCTTAASNWGVYNPSSTGASEGVTGFTHERAYWDLVGQNALKQTMINGSSLNNEWYMIAANYRRHNVSDVYGLLMTTKMTADNNPVTAGWDNRYNKCVKQNIDDDLFYEDFWVPFGAGQSLSDMTVGMYSMFPASPMTAWFSNIRAVRHSEPTMVSSGEYISPTKTYATNIKDLILVDVTRLRGHQTGTWSFDISLDGGNHWKNSISANTLLNVAADLTAPSSGTWDNPKNLKLRYTATRGSATALGQGPELTGTATIVRTE